MLYNGKSVNKFYDQLLAFIKEGKSEKFQGIVKNVATSDLIYGSGNLLLHWSAKLGNKEITQYLINIGYNIDAQDNDGNTPLMLVVEADKEYMMEVLIKAGANIYIDNKKGKCPIKFVLSSWDLSHRGAVKLFLDRLQDDCGGDKKILVNKLVDFECPIYFVVLLRDAEITRMMLDHGYSLASRCPKMHDTALHESVAQSDLANVKLLVERGADINVVGYKKETPLCRYNVWTKDTYEKLRMLKYLMVNGSALYYPKKNPAIRKLFEDGNKETVCMVLQMEGIDLHVKYDKSRTALHLICRNKNPGMAEAIKLFRGKDFDIDAVDKDNWTALMTAASRRRIGIVECLLKMDANMNSCKESGLDILHEACRNYCRWIQEPRENNGKIVNLLLQYGVDILQSRNNRGEHFLLDVSMRRDQEVAKSVLARLAQMEVLGEFGILNSVRRDIADQGEQFEEYYLSCLKHLEEIKIFKVYGSITLLDLLNRSEKNLNVAVRNQDFMLEFNRVMAEKHDAIPNYYSSTIRKRVAEAITRVSLQEKAANVICKIIGLAEMHIVACKIVSYLKSQDLMNLIEINLVIK